MSPEQQTIYDLEHRVADLELEVEAAHRHNDANTQTRERHALQVIADIAQQSATGSNLPTLENVRLEFGLFCERIATKQNAKWLNVCVDALDDIIAGRMNTATVSAAELIERSR